MTQAAAVDRIVPPVLTLSVLPDRYSICRLDPREAVPPWATRGPFFSLTRTRDELSIVCAAGDVPEGVRSETGWCGLGVHGPLDFNLTGIVAELSTGLAAGAISVFVVSTYDTDYLFVRETDLARAVGVLRDRGHVVKVPCPGR